MAEEAAEELSKREVSDVDNKRKRLKPAKKPKCTNSKDYNLMAQECIRNKNTVLSEANGKRAAEHGKNQSQPQAAASAKPEDFPDENVLPAQPTQTSQTLTTKAVRAQPQRSAPLQHPPNAAVQIQQNVSSAGSNAPCTSDAGAESVHPNAGPSSHAAGTTIQLVQPVSGEHSDRNDVLPNSVQFPGSYILAPMDPATTSTKILTGLSPTQSIHIDSETAFVNQDDVMYYAPAFENDPMANIQISGAMSYEQMKADLKECIETTVEKVVEKCFQTNFARFAALSEIQRKEDSDDPKPRDSVERHTPINTEEELKNWNIELNSKELCRKYETWTDTHQERLDLQRARVLEVNRHLMTLAESWERGGFPMHMNLALRPAGTMAYHHPTQQQQRAQQTQQSAINASGAPGNQQTEMVNRLKQQNVQLSEEVNQKNEKLSLLEREKSSLIRELLQLQRATRASSMTSNTEELVF